MIHDRSKGIDTQNAQRVSCARYSFVVTTATLPVNAPDGSWSISSSVSIAEAVVAAVNLQTLQNPTAHPAKLNFGILLVHLNDGFPLLTLVWRVTSDLKLATEVRIVSFHCLWDFSLIARLSRSSTSTLILSTIVWMSPFSQTAFFILSDWWNWESTHLLYINLNFFFVPSSHTVAVRVVLRGLLGEELTNVQLFCNYFIMTPCYTDTFYSHTITSNKFKTTNIYISWH